LKLTKKKVYSLFPKKGHLDWERRVGTFSNFYPFWVDQEILTILLSKVGGSIGLGVTLKHLIYQAVSLTDGLPFETQILPWKTSKNPFEHPRKDQTGLEESKTRINNFETKGKEYQNPAIFHDFHEA